MEVAPAAYRDWIRIVAPSATEARPTSQRPAAFLPFSAPSERAAGLLTPAEETSSISLALAGPHQGESVGSPQWDRQPTGSRLRPRARHHMPRDARYSLIWLSRPI